MLVCVKYAISTNANEAFCMEIMQNFTYHNKILLNITFLYYMSCAKSNQLKVLDRVEMRPQCHLCAVNLKFSAIQQQKTESFLYLPFMQFHLNTKYA